MKYILLSSLLVVVFEVAFFLILAVRLRKTIRRVNAVSLIDRNYAIALLLMSLTYVLYCFFDVFSMLSNIALFENEPLPFVVYSMPLITILLSTMANEGMFAYTNETLYSARKSWNMSDVQTVSVKKSFKHAKIIIIANGADNFESEKIIFRTSTLKANAFVMRGKA